MVVGFAVATRSFSWGRSVSLPADSIRHLDNEALALLTRLNRVKPLALQIPSVPAAAISTGALAAIDQRLANGRKEILGLVSRFRRWLKSTLRGPASPSEAQRRFTLLRLKFNAVLSQLDLFHDAVVQRTEADFGVWLRGLDVLANDALALPGYYKNPPLVCYLDRGAGAAIRRQNTRLPGGDRNPVALIRIPRERMLSSSVASSLVHEVGHSAAARLDLVDSLRPAIDAAGRSASQRDERAWRYWSLWISEIVADLWAVGRLGITATKGLIGVVSLPRAMVFRIVPNDPHPFPWIRVKTGIAIGRALFPDPQWDRLERLWEDLYPISGLDETRSELVRTLRKTMPRMVRLLLEHRPDKLQGTSVTRSLQPKRVSPGRLRSIWKDAVTAGAFPRGTRPYLAAAAIGQARADERLGPTEENKWLAHLFNNWALSATARQPNRPTV